LSKRVLICRPFKASVALAACATVKNGYVRTDFGDIEFFAIFGARDSADGDLENSGVAVFAVTIIIFSCTTILCTEFFLVTKWRKRGQILDTFKNDIATLAAITTSRAAFLGAFDMEPTDNAVASLARVRGYRYLVYECHSALTLPHPS
jgi:hypothetical protein